LVVDNDQHGRKPLCLWTRPECVVDLGDELLASSNILWRMLVIPGLEVIGRLDDRVAWECPVLAVRQEVLKVDDALCRPEVSLSVHLRRDVANGRGVKEVGVVQLPRILEIGLVQSRKNRGRRKGQRFGLKIWNDHGEP